MNSVLIDLFENKHIILIPIIISGGVLILCNGSSGYDQSIIALLVTLAYLAYSYLLCKIGECVKTRRSPAIEPVVVENIEMGITA